MKIIILLCFADGNEGRGGDQNDSDDDFPEIRLWSQTFTFHVAMFNPPFSMQHGIVIIIIVLKSTYPKVFQLANVFWKLLQAILVKIEHLQQFGP